MATFRCNQCGRLFYSDQIFKDGVPKLCDECKPPVIPSTGGMMKNTAKTKFISFTYSNGNMVYIKPDDIRCFQELGSGETRIKTHFDLFIVKETPEEVR